MFANKLGIIANQIYTWKTKQKISSSIEDLSWNRKGIQLLIDTEEFK